MNKEELKYLPIELIVNLLYFGTLCMLFSTCGFKPIQYVTLSFVLYLDKSILTAKTEYLKSKIKELTKKED